MKTSSILKSIVFVLILLFNDIEPIIAKNHFILDDNPSPPQNPVRLVFIHHSTGGNWLANQWGGLGKALKQNNYYVSDVCYGWGVNSIGDRTDLGHWWEWFRDPENSSIYMNDIFNIDQMDGQYGEFDRLSPNPDPSGENQIIMFKSCFPNSVLRGNPDDPVPSIDTNPMKGQWAESESYTVANAKGIYIDILEYFKTRQDKLFIVVTAPPLLDATYANNARAFNLWLVNNWLIDYPYNNVFVFDFYNTLTTNGGNPETNDLNFETGNHHRWWNNQVQYSFDGKSNTLKYPSDGDEHPNPVGNAKTTAEFLPLLNVAYNRWINSSTDIPEKKLDNYSESYFYVAPDPVSCNSVIKYHLKKISILNISLCNTFGQIIDSFIILPSSKNSYIQYDFSKLENGFYFFIFDSQGRKQITSFLVLR